MNEKFKKDAEELICELCKNLYLGGTNAHKIGFSDYRSQRSAILRLFNITGGSDYSKQSISLRLTIIDSLYSTNANYNYYSIDNLAEAIWSLGTEQQVREYYNNIARERECEKDLFSSKYGYHKNLNIGGMLISLISKYGNFVMQQDVVNYPLGFPIYDSLIIKMLPKICANLDVVACSYKGNGIKPLVSVLEKVRKSLFGKSSKVVNGFQQFDALDAYMWHLGKIDSGNYSLLFNQTDYEKFICNLDMKGKHYADFFAEVTKRCSMTNTEDVVAGTSNSVIMQKMINHWKTYFLRN